MVKYDEKQQHNYQYIILKVDSQNYGHNRDELKQHLEQNNIMARRYFHPGCHRMEPYQSMPDVKNLNLSETEHFSEQVLALPNGSQLGTDDVHQVCELIRNF